MLCRISHNLSCIYCKRPVSHVGVKAECAALSSNVVNLIATARPANRPGTELSKLLKRFGIEPTPTCACRAKQQEMDRWGCDECSKPERIDEVVAVMRAEAEARGLPFIDLAGRMLVRRAIANARRNA
jgi:hypothetical protein